MKFLILGAGPAGLSFANRLKQNGEDDFLVLEKESIAGGLCRSQIVDGFPFDIGGGHFLDVRRPKVNEFLFQFMPEREWNIFERDSRIDLDGNMINHPIEANIWQLPKDLQNEYLESIKNAGCNIGEEKPSLFIDWIYWKLGKKIADSYMIPYNQKMFGDNLNQLGTYWLEKLPNVSYEETKLSCENKKAYGTQPGHARFYYPKKYGYGELWLRMADAIKKNIKYNSQVSYIDFENRIVKTIDNNEYSADYIITTIPWQEFNNVKGLDDEIINSISKLKYTSVVTEYHNENLNTTCHWIYYPNPNLSYHRILVRHNFCKDSKGYWTETNLSRVTKDNNNFKYINKYAYPLNTVDKPMVMGKLLKESKKKNVIGLGRWGEHCHYNSDLVVELALKLADELTKAE